MRLFDRHAAELFAFFATARQLETAAHEHRSHVLDDHVEASAQSLAAREWPKELERRCHFIKRAQPVPRRTGRDEGALYEIPVEGVLDQSWSDWLDGMPIQPQPCGETPLTGAIPDQAAHHGLLNETRDMGLPMLCIKSGKRPARVE